MTVRVISSEKNWMEGAALEQLNRTAQLPGVIDAIGMPDLHPGKDAPIGAVFSTDTYIYPHLVDGDIGCGISLWQLDLPKAKVTADKLNRRLGPELEGAWDGDISDVLQAEGVDKRTAYDESSLGTIGHGNHFAEIAWVQKVFAEESFAALRLDKRALYLLVHSGSRGFGESILDQHARQFGKAGLAVDSAEAKAYIAAHNHALAWARANRTLIAHRFMVALGTNGRQILDLSHNHMLPTTIDGQPGWLHRKGAVATDNGPVVIAGSRGSFSYLVEATGDQAGNLHTVAHGAGRKWRRSECRGRLEERFSPKQLLRTELGSQVICDDKDLLYEEAPQAYKNVDVVVNDLVNAELIRVIAAFSPIITYKKRKVER